MKGHREKVPHSFFWGGNWEAGDCTGRNAMYSALICDFVHLHTLPFKPTFHLKKKKGQVREKGDA